MREWDGEPYVQHKVSLKYKKPRSPGPVKTKLRGIGLLYQGSCWLAFFALFRFSQRKKPMFRQIPTAVDTGAARPILVRLAFGWILI